MVVIKKDFFLIIGFLLFAASGICLIFSVDYLTSKQVLNATIRWCGIPSLALAGLYAYRAIFGNKTADKIWKKILGFIILTYAVAMVILGAFQGYLIGINARFGTQKTYFLEGKITKLDYPEEKKPGNKYAIEIVRLKEGDTLNLSVPTNQYSEGQYFSKSMKIGSLGFIYSNN